MSRSAKRWMSPTSTRSRAAPDGPMPVQVHQRGSAGSDQLAQLFLDRLDLLVDGLELDDQLDREPAPGLADDVAGLDGGDHCLGLVRGQELLCPAWEELQQQLVQPVDGLGPGPAQLVATVDQHPHHHQVVVDLNPDQVRGAQRDHRHRVRIHRVGLAAVAGGEHPHLRGQLRGHVDHGLAVMDQPMRDVLADAVATLDRPDPIRVLPASGKHLAHSRPCRCRTGRSLSTRPRSSTTSIVADRLCGSIPMITPIRASSSH